MPMIKWTPMIDPFQEMDKFFEDFSPMMGRKGQSFLPAIDVYEDNDNVIVEASLPGIDIKNVDIAIENDILTIEGRSEKKTEVDEKDYYRKEVYTGSYHRAVQLPKAVSGDKASANYDDGILRITIPIEERIKPKSIKIDVKK